jgi:hypothetical protein
VGSYNFTVLWVGMSEDILDEIVAILIASNVYKRDARTVMTTLTDTIKVSSKEVGAPDFQTFLDNLGCELVHTIFRCISDDMIDRTTAVSRSTVFTDMLDAPVAELTVSDNINASEDLFNAWALYMSVNNTLVWLNNLLCLPLGNSQRCFERPDYQSHPEQPRATYLGGHRLHIS